MNKRFTFYTLLFDSLSIPNEIDMLHFPITKALDVESVTEANTRILVRTQSEAYFKYEDAFFVESLLLTISISIKKVDYGKLNSTI